MPNVRHKNRSSQQDRKGRWKVKNVPHDKALNGGKVIKEKFKEERLAKVAPLVAQNANQKVALRNLQTKQLNLLLGSAGAGKSELMCWYASKLWLEGKVDTIIITRPNKALGADGGAVPGNDTQKILAYVMSMLMKFKKYLGAGTLRNNLRMEMMDMLFNEVNGICVYPVEKLQGLSFDSRTIVLADEMQSATIAQVKSLVTRMEEGAQIIIAGDITQSALKGKNGLQYLKDVVEAHEHEEIGVVQFTPEDCCRYGISAHFTKVFEEQGQW